MFIWIINVLKFKQGGPLRGIQFLFCFVRKASLLGVRLPIQTNRTNAVVVYWKRSTSISGHDMFGCGKMTQIQLFTPLIENRLLFVIEAFLPFWEYSIKKKAVWKRTIHAEVVIGRNFYIINQWWKSGCFNRQSYLLGTVMFNVLSS